MITPTLKELVIIHLNYRDVFNAAVNVYDLQRWIGLTATDQLRRELNALEAEGLIETRDDLNYCVAGRSAILRHQVSKQRLSRKVLRSHEKIINYLSWIPFIRFIGISGSIAAENPTIEKVGLRKGSVDLDVFVVTTGNTLWLVFYFERLMANIFSVLLKDRYTFCFNYAMDATFLEIHNKSIYTATELVNLKPMYDRSNTYQSLLNANGWVKKYYPSFAARQTPIDKGVLRTLIKRIGAVVFYPFNLGAFTLFHLSRVVKRLSLKPLADIRIEFNPEQPGNLKRVNAPGGGYERLIMERFERKFKDNFTHYYTSRLMQYLFPEQNRSFAMDPRLLKGVEEAFTKYSTL